MPQAILLHALDDSRLNIPQTLELILLAARYRTA